MLKHIFWPKVGWFAFHAVVIAAALALGALVDFG